MIDMSKILDEKDQNIARKLAETFASFTKPQIGDFVRFADRHTRRISHIWGFNPEIQTSDGGSFYLGDGFVSFSGGLYPAIPADTLTLSEERRDGAFWFFSHNIPGAGRGVPCMAPCRVWLSNMLGADPWRPKARL